MGLSDKDAHDALQNALLRENGYEEISFGLLVSILTEPQNAPKGYRDLTLITRDGFNLVLTHLSQLVLDRYDYMFYSKSRLMTSELLRIRMLQGLSVWLSLLKIFL